MVPAVKLETFFDHLMPQPTEGLRTESQLDAFMEQLQEGPSAPLKRKGEEYSWSSFPESPESTDGLSEADTFQQLEHVVNDISAAASAYLTSLTGAEPVHRFFYKNNRAHRTPESLYRNNASRPDGYFLTYDPHDTVSDEKPRWWNIGPLGEFKKSSGKANAADVRGATYLTTFIYSCAPTPGYAEGPLGHEPRHAQGSPAPRSLWLYHGEHDDPLLVLRSLSSDR